MDGLVKFFGYVLLAVIAICFVLGFWWLLWKLWMWVIPQVFTTASPAIAKPGYWLFVGMVIIASFIGNLLFGKKS